MAALAKERDLQGSVARLEVAFRRLVIVAFAGPPPQWNWIANQCFHCYQCSSCWFATRYLRKRKGNRANGVGHMVASIDSDGGRT